jgi:hypothetical protein
MAIPNEFFLFRKYTKAVKEYLQDKCYLSRYSKTENVLVMYETPARAYAKFLYPIQNGQQARPVVSFHLSNYQYTQNENHLGFVNDYTYHSSSGNIRSAPPLLIYNLTYTLVLRTLLMSDMDILIYQIISTANKNKKHCNIIDGQWMELTSTDPRDETNLEPGDAEDRIIRFGMDMVVPRAYLPREVEEIEPVEQWQIEYQVANTGDSIGDTLVLPI